MRVLFVAIGSILIVIGILMVPLGLWQYSVPLDHQWDLIRSQNEPSSFTNYLSTGSYKIQVNSYSQGVSSIEIRDNSGYTVYRFELMDFVQYFSIANAGNYYFQFNSFVASFTVYLYKESSQVIYYTYHPYGGWEWGGVLVSVAGLGVLAYGLIAKRRL